jgi:hypothetical protein
MMNSRSADHGNPPKVLSPLWMISLFLGISEVSVTIATTQAIGWIQSMLAIFAVAFPVLVFSAFFLTLWKNNKVLYAPGEFTSDTPVRDYVEAMNRHNQRSVNVVESALQSALTRLADQLEVLGATVSQRDEIVESVSTAVHRAVITIDVSVFNSKARTVDVAVDDRTTVTDLLDSVYFAIWDKVENFSYGKTWLLLDERNGRRLDDIGTHFAHQYLKTNRDYRSLTEIGVRPESTLAVIPFSLESRKSAKT